jgi:hypothetical protein
MMFATPSGGTVPNCSRLRSTLNNPITVDILIPKGLRAEKNRPLWGGLIAQPRVPPCHFLSIRIANTWCYRLKKSNPCNLRAWLQPHPEHSDSTVFNRPTPSAWLSRSFSRPPAYSVSSVGADHAFARGHTSEHRGYTHRNFAKSQLCLKRFFGPTLQIGSGYLGALEPKELGDPWGSVEQKKPAIVS